MKRWRLSFIFVVLLGFLLLGTVTGKRVLEARFSPQFVGQPFPATDPQVYVEVEKVKVRLAQAKTKREFDLIIERAQRGQPSEWSFQDSATFMHDVFEMNSKFKKQRDALPPQWCAAIEIFNRVQKGTTNLAPFLNF